MKFTCDCGATIVDVADGAPNKAHLIPDQRWLSLLEELDQLIERAAADRMRAEGACMAARRSIGEAARQMYQCISCGRLHVDDQDHNLHSFSPADERSQDILRGGA